MCFPIFFNQWGPPTAVVNEKLKQQRVSHAFFPFCCCCETDMRGREVNRRTLVDFSPIWAYRGPGAQDFCPLGNKQWKCMLLFDLYKNVWLVKFYFSIRIMENGCMVKFRFSLYVIVQMCSCILQLLKRMGWTSCQILWGFCWIYKRYQ